MASSIGSSHVVAGMPCQDSHCHLAMRDSFGRRVVVLVAADGAGTASVAEIGAALACETFAKLVEAYIEYGGRLEDINRALMSRWVAGVVFRLSLRAEADGIECHEYACTLLAAIIGESTTAFMQIGDGAIVTSDGEADGWSYVFWPQHGEFANTTNFITSENALQAMEFDAIGHAVEEIALFTDGLENLVLNKAEKTVHAPFFDSMFRSVRASAADGVDAALSQGLEKYLSGPVITERTDDDKTLILATRRPVAAAQRR